MPVTTVKRCQSEPDWWYTVEDVNVEVENEPGTGICIRYFDELKPEGITLLSVNKEDALLLIEALNQLYPTQFL